MLREIFGYLLLALNIFLSVSSTTNIKQLGGDFSTTPLKDGRTGQCSTSGFICTFSESSCPYGGTEDNQWMKLEGFPNQDEWVKSVSIGQNTDSPAAGVQLSESSPMASFVSDTITCQNDDGRVIFSYWTTPNVNLQVCAVSKATDADILCSETFTSKSFNYPGPNTFQLPQPIKEPFYIRYLFSTAPPSEGFAILDDISYFGSGCQTETCDGSNTGIPTVATTAIPIEVKTTITTTPKSTTTSTTTKTTTTSTGKPSTTTTTTSLKPTTTRTTVRPTTKPQVTTLPPINICRQLACDFERDFCNYKNYNGATVQFDRRNAGFGPGMSRITDIQPNGGTFVAARLKAVRTDVAVLESPTFKMPMQRTLTFSWFRGTDGSTIKLCQETANVKFWSLTSLKECQSIIPKLDRFNARIWNNASFTLYNDVTKFYLVAIQESSNSGDAAIGIDNISLNNC